MFSSVGVKDSLTNVQETGVFTVSLATEDLFDEMNITSFPANYGTDEFELAGLTARQGNYVNAPCVAESPAVLECELWRVIDLPPGNRVKNAGNHMVIGHVIGIYIDEKYIKDGLFDIRAVKPVGRLGYMDYGIINETNFVTKNRPKLDEKGKLSLVKEWDGTFK